MDTSPGNRAAGGASPPGMREEASSSHVRTQNLDLVSMLQKQKERAKTKNAKNATAAVFIMAPEYFLQDEPPPPTHAGRTPEHSRHPG